MNQVEFLAQQTEDVYAWTNKLIASVPYEKWNIIPEGIATSLAWQTGHLVMSHYFHTMMTVVGHQMDILQKMPVKEYAEYFTLASPKDSQGKVDPKILHEHLRLVQQKSLQIISSLTDTELVKDLEPTPTPHPIAKNKLETLDWNIKHTMYHCGQIGMVKRAVDQRYDFGLRINK